MGARSASLGFAVWAGGVSSGFGFSSGGGSRPLATGGVTVGLAVSLGGAAGGGVSVSGVASAARGAAVVAWSGPDWRAVSCFCCGSGAGAGGAGGGRRQRDERHLDRGRLGRSFLAPAEQQPEGDGEVQQQCRRNRDARRTIRPCGRTGDPKGEIGFAHRARLAHLRQPRPRSRP